jgi:hypothetical protein
MFSRLGVARQVNGFKIVVAEFRTSWFWFWFVSFPYHRALRCPFGKHEQLVMHITDGRTSIGKCVYCDACREPTAEEVAAHPNAGYTPEQQAAENAKVDQLMQYLAGRYGFSDRK